MTRQLRTIALLTVCAAVHPPLPAQALRDPMQPPATARSSGRSAPAPAPEPALPAVQHLMVVGEQRWVIVGGRRRGVGDMLGSARIERIEDSAVVVRQGATLQRLPLFAGVVKQAAGGAPASAAPASQGHGALAGAAHRRP